MITRTIWDASLADWANAKPDIAALVQIGSRVQSDVTPDEWSDYDYQLITTHPSRYLNGGFAREIGEAWVVATERAFGDATKVTAVFNGGLEADFVILAKWEVLIATAALATPIPTSFWPSTLRRGVEDFRCVAGRGWKIVKGGAAWEKRYGRLTPFQRGLTEEMFQQHVSSARAHAVWIAKKILRGELIAARRMLHRGLIETTIKLMEEEALAAGKAARPEGRRAETWLKAERSASLDGRSSLERRILAAELLRQAALAEEVGHAVAASRGWGLEDAPDLHRWLREQLWATASQ
jgi:hypothetical protein